MTHILLAVLSLLIVLPAYAFGPRRQHEPKACADLSGRYCFIAPADCRKLRFNRTYERMYEFDMPNDLWPSTARGWEMSPVCFEIKQDDCSHISFRHDQGFIAVTLLPPAHFSGENVFDAGWISNDTLEIIHDYGTGGRAGRRSLSWQIQKSDYGGVFFKHNMGWKPQDFPFKTKSGSLECYAKPDRAEERRADPLPGTPLDSCQPEKMAAAPVGTLCRAKDAGAGTIVWRVEGTTDAGVRYFRDLDSGLLVTGLVARGVNHPEAKTVCHADSKAQWRLPTGYDHRLNGYYGFGLKDSELQSLRHGLTSLISGFRSNYMYLWSSSIMNLKDGTSYAFDVDWQSQITFHFPDIGPYFDKQDFGAICVARD